MTARPWHRAIAYALVGEEVSLPATDAPDIPRLVEQLDAAGWPARRVADAARAALGEPWPHPIPAALRPGMGAAQLAAAVGEARAAYGLVALDVRTPTPRTALTPEERRLLADRPPHYGR